MVAKYRKKPVVIEAIQVTDETVNEAVNWLIDEKAPFEINVVTGVFLIHTMEGDMEVSSGDFIIKGIKGEFYPCKPDIFEATYDKA